MSVLALVAWLVATILFVLAAVDPAPPRWLPLGLAFTVLGLMAQFYFTSHPIHSG